MFPILVIENKTSTFLKIKKFIILNIVTVPNHNNGSGNVKNVSTILTLQINEDRMKKRKNKKGGKRRLRDSNSRGETPCT